MSMKRRAFLSAGALAAIGSSVGRKTARAASASFLSMGNRSGEGNPQSFSLPAPGTLSSLTATMADGSTVPSGATVSATVVAGADTVTVTITAGKRTAKATSAVSLAVGEIANWYPSATGMGNVPAVNVVLGIS